ncbi:unnamed protein product [Photorhabdus laumondii subsp. laumondii TTO1]|uniref:Photorhabdus luminescens subsp. laumondii TTO1 complete genome segment 12/17 n=1 Tax=Photorhabdus laumondii subsp. laumondii (strain DSM 15139 / CIP 105565 / TT01) TaxID=243265 RepID=Q7N1F1_PHOLL|nr:unnamed protein product [Photorhabdus laumondii subsp. laumondii TTO1]
MKGLILKVQCEKGTTIWEVVSVFKEMYDSDVFPALTIKSDECGKRIGH